jgi:hypothetical protein
MGDVAQDIKAFKKARPSRRQGLQEGKKGLSDEDRTFETEVARAASRLLI